MKILKLLIVLGLLTYTSLCKAQQGSKIIYNSKAYTITNNKVIQGKYTAKALSSTEITSDYQSLANQIQSPGISFKFSINGKDNEMAAGTKHRLVIEPVDGAYTTPLIKFGHPYKGSVKTSTPNNLKPDTRLIIRLDMRDVLEDFKSKGFYTTFNGDKIYKEDFKVVYVAGSASPMIWDYDNLANRPELQLKDPDGDGIYEGTLVLNKQKDKKLTASAWTLSRDISDFPKYKSEYVLPDALYNMSLEEMQNAVESDSTFRTGKEWGGVWTRDISYSIILSMAILQPKVAQYSLLRKVRNGRVIQDTGTGGSYPVSSDRMIWAVAAWEIYKTTGDREWLRKAYEIIKNSVEDDLKNVYDKETGLVKGESSFLDWREQTYPKWMQPADIYDSECLGTNAVHFEVNKVLSEMADLLNEPDNGQKYKCIAQNIKNGINKFLWIPEKGYYGQYLYGRNYKILSQRSEALGEALCIIFGIADDDRARTIVASAPVNDFGLPCIYPQIADIPPYHNNAVWPFVQSYWTLAAARAGNENALVHSISAVYRPLALFLTDKENFVASNGDFAGTQINSSNMLWTLSGNISMVYKGLFGMDFQPDGISFKPFVPESLQGERSLRNFRYRDAVLDVNMYGYGNKIKSVQMDGKPLFGATLPGNTIGRHNIKIVLEHDQIVVGKVTLLNNAVSPLTPILTYSEGELSWNKVINAVKYMIIRNGKKVAETLSEKFLIRPRKVMEEYQIVAEDAQGLSSFASEPIRVFQYASVQIVEAEAMSPRSDLPYSGFSGSGFVEINKTAKENLNFQINIPEDGIYAVDFKYANGNGPISTDNKCALRTLSHDDEFKGTIVFPQRGKGEWSNWGFSNPLRVKLTKGMHNLLLSFKPWNENMNADINQAMLDYMRIVRLE